MAKYMEFLNKMELRGVVGRVDTQVYGEKSVTTFSVVTEYCSFDAKGNSTVDCTWFHVSVWDNEVAQKLRRGDWVHVVGRIRIRKFVSAEGDERESYDILAQSVDLD